MEEKIELHDNKMGTMPIKKLLMSMALPAILSMTINALYNVVDSIFVSRISEDALTAVSIVNPIQLMIIALSVGSGVGINSLISRRLGAKNQEEADKAASTSIRIPMYLKKCAIPACKDKCLFEGTCRNPHLLMFVQ